MVYSAKHKYLTIHWTMTASNIEEGQMGIRFASALDPTEAELDAAAAVVSSNWSTAINLWPDDYRLSSLKLATIQPDGKYPDGFEPLIHDYAPVVPGGTAIAISQYPLQVASVGSLLTDAARGRAHRGRVYMPPIAGNLDANYLFSPTNCAARAQALGTMIELLNTAIVGAASVMSKIGTGTTRPITGVEVGTRPDVQRRRAGRQPETYSFYAVD